MDNESAIIQLLTEIRDNQRTQLEWARGATATQHRRALIAAIIVGIGMGLLILAFVLNQAG